MTSLAGSFLIAKPILPDPNFVQTVVLILQHDAEGAFGLVVNRPAEAEGVPFPVYIGGPCPTQGLYVLHGHSEWTNPSEEDEVNEIAPGVFIGDAESLQRVSELEEGQTARFRVFANYSGWGPDQLERELASSVWIVTPANAQLVFDTPIEELWDKLSPPSLPRPSDN